MRDVVEIVVPRSFITALFALRHAIEAAGMVVFASIDRAGAAQDVGLSIPPTMLLLYGNARGGSQAVICEPQIALDLPLRVLLRQGHDGKVLLSYHRVAPLLSAADIPAAIAERLVDSEHVGHCGREPMNTTWAAPGAARAQALVDETALRR